MFLVRHRDVGAILAVVMSTLCGVRAAHAVTVVDDTTTVTYSSPAGSIGSFADFPVVRKFDGNIQSITVEIVDGNADDIGFVGNLLVTDIKPRCAAVGRVVGPVDVTSEVTVAGDTASFVLRAQENCCCVTGWGPATQGDRAPATFHWHVTIANTCDLDPSGTCGECEGHTELADEAKPSFKVDATTSCPANLGGGKAGLELALSASGSLSPASCGSECKGKLDIGGSVSGTAHMCGGSAQGVSAGFTYSEEREFAKLCNQDTCETECDFTRSCISSKATGQIGLSTERTIGQDFTLRPPGTRSIAATVLCDVKLGVNHQLALSTKTDFPAGRDDCKSCDEQNIGYTMTGTAGGNCLIGLSGFGRSFDFGCDDCVELATAISISGTLRSGPDCSGGACLSGSVKATGTVKAPEHCLSLFGYVVKTRLSASATGSCSVTSCSQDPPRCVLEATGAMDFTTQVGSSCD